MHSDHAETMHEHVHTHADGTTHSHAHHHHEDINDHAHHEGLHSSEQLNCAECGYAHETSREETIALLRYMIGHNTAHAAELKELAGQVQAMGEAAAAEEILQAVRDFETGSGRLSSVLAEMTK